MHDTLPQGVKSIHALLQKKEIKYNDYATEISYITCLPITIVGCLNGGQIENITKCINTILWH